MFSFQATNVNQALQFAIEHLLHEGVEGPSRVGTVMAAPGPVLVEYTKPRERVLYSSTRDANHVFHVMEFIWFLTGSNELEFPLFFNSKYDQFSDDGRTMWDSYGWRWRRFFDWDQLDAIVAELKSNPTSRRCVLTMWNAYRFGPDDVDFEQNPVLMGSGPEWGSDFQVATRGGLAVPCNTHCYFAVRGGKLDLTVCNRSNDLFHGMMGANSVTFSFLLEYMAARVGLPIGSYYQFTNNMHFYTDKFSLEKVGAILNDCIDVSEWNAVPETGPAIEAGIDDDLKLFMPWALKVIHAKPGAPEAPASDEGQEGWSIALDVPACKTEFMQSVVVPMFLFWVYRKWKDEYSSQTCLEGIDAPDWHRAITEWVERRRK